MKYVCRIFGIGVIMFAVGCNSEKLENSTNEINFQLVSNSYSFIKAGKKEQVFSLSENIDKDSLVINSISSDCEELNVSGHNVFSYSVNDSICDYSITYRERDSHDRGKMFRNNLLVIATKKNDYDKIVKFSGLGQKLEFDINEELNLADNEYELLSVKSLSGGNIEYGRAPAIVKYTPKTEGIKRIAYTIENQSGDKKIGIIDIYIVDDNKNLAVANATMNLTYQMTASYEIDLAAIYSVNTIGQYQLVDVKEINNSVYIEPSNRETLNNKRFTLSAQSTGTYYVVVVLINERGDIGNSVLKIVIS